jgi:hypothetical protein
MGRHFCRTRRQLADFMWRGSLAAVQASWSLVTFKFSVPPHESYPQALVLGLVAGGEQFHEYGLGLARHRIAW